MKDLTFVVARKNAGEYSQWIEFVKCDDIDFARYAMSLAARSYAMVGIFYNKIGWQDKAPRYIIDNRDLSKAPIRNAENIINSASSTVI